MEDSEEKPVKKDDGMMFIIQFITAAFLVVVLLALLNQIDRLSIKDSPVLLVYISLASLVFLTYFHTPVIFLRLSQTGKVTAYAGVLVSMLIVGEALGQLEAAYERTPAGAQEAAARKAAADEQRLQNVEEEKLARHDKRQSICESLIPQVKEILERKYSVEVIETNDVVAHDEETHETPLTCTVEAITSEGKHVAAYRLERTPQEKVLVSVQLLN